MRNTDFNTEGRSPSGWLFAAMYIIIAILLLCCTFGCKTKYITQTEYKYKEVPVQVHDTLFKNVFKYDTTYVKDSVFLYLKGDTVYKEKWRTQYAYHIVLDTVNRFKEVPVAVHDTAYIDRNTVQEKIIYRQHWWQSALTWGGGIALVAVCLFIYRRLKQ